MRRFQQALAAGLAVIGLGLGDRSSFAQEVVPIDLGTLGHGFSAAYALNDSGQVVGQALAASENGTTAHAFLWDAQNGMQDLGTLNNDPNGLSESYANDVNNSGQVVGYSFTGSVQHAFVWDAQQGMIDLTPDPMVFSSTATTINDFSVAAGYQSWPHVPFVWDAVNGVQPIPGGISPFSVNNFGELAGIGPDLTAVRFDAVNGYLTLDPAGGDDGAYAWSISDAGEVAGASGVVEVGLYGPVLTKPRAVIWVNSTAFVLPTPGFAESEALAINFDGDAVGYARSNASSDTVAVAWIDGEMIVLNDVIDPGSGWNLRNACDVNSNRQICGVGTIGGETHAFLLDLDDGTEPPPGPEPPPAPELPDLVIGAVAVVEGRRGNTNAIFAVELSIPSTETVTVDYSTADGTATTANRDYTETSGTLTFSPGESSLTITVKVRGDRKQEPDEVFFVDLSNVNGAVLATSSAQCVILNDD